MDRFEGLREFGEVILYLENYSRNPIYSKRKRVETYNAIINARYLVNDIDYSSSQKECSHGQKAQALRLIHPIYVDLNIGLKILGRLIGRSAGWLSIGFASLGLARKSNHQCIERRATKFSCDTRVFETWGHDMAYWLAFIWTDGYVRNSLGRFLLRVVVKREDHEHLVLMKKFLVTDAPIKYKEYSARKGGKTYPQAVLSIDRKELANSLSNYKLIAGRSVNNIEIPKIPKAFLWDFIRGFFDGDGAIHRPQKCKFICSGWVISFSGSKSNLEFLKKVIYRDLGIYMELRLNGRSCRNYRLSRSGPAIFDLLDRLYPNEETLGLERKKSVIRHLLGCYRHAISGGVTVKQRGDGLRFILPEGYNPEYRE